MTTHFDNFMSWAKATGGDLRMCVGILAIWFASWVIPAGHASQIHLRNAVAAMDD